MGMGRADPLISPAGLMSSSPHSADDADAAAAAEEVTEDAADAADAGADPGAEGAGGIEASETGAAVAVAIPAHVFTAFRRDSSVRGRRKGATRKSIGGK